MGKIGNEEFYPLAAALAGTTVIGSLPDKTTVQLDLLASIKSLGSDFTNINKATEAGQSVLGNEPSIPETNTPNVNNGNRFFGTIKTYRAVLTDYVDADFNIIAKFNA